MGSKTRRIPSVFSTPQTKRNVRNVVRQSVSAMQLNVDDDESPNTLFNTIMSDPAKRALLLELLSKENDTVSNCIKDQIKKCDTPVKKLKNQIRYESPSALFRRRQLEQRKKSESDSSTSSEINIRQENIKPAPVPYEKLLEGLKIYVEVRSKGEDKSAVAKAVIQSMGATIRHKFTRDVTHVIFKDGYYTTYQKAKLLKVHLVSILWLEAVRKNHARVPEKNYPALGLDTNKADVSTICQKMQKEYNDIIKEEYRRSLNKNVPYTPCKTPKRNKTILYSTTDISETLPSTPNSESVTSHNNKKSHLSNDQFLNLSPEIISDDSDGGIIDGNRARNITPYALNKSEIKSRAKIRKTIFNCIENLESTHDNEELAEVNTTNSTTGSVSLLTGDKLKKDYKINKTTTEVNDMELTQNILNLDNCENNSTDMPPLRISTENSETNLDKSSSRSSSNYVESFHISENEFSVTSKMQKKCNSSKKNEGEESLGDSTDIRSTENLENNSDERSSRSKSKYLQRDENLHVSKNESSVITKKQKKRNSGKKNEGEESSGDSTDIRSTENLENNSDERSSRSKSKYLQGDENLHVSKNEPSVITKKQKKRNSGKKNEGEESSGDSTDIRSLQISSENSENNSDERSSRSKSKYLQRDKNLHVAKNESSLTTRKQKKRNSGKKNEDESSGDTTDMSPLRISTDNSVNKSDKLSSKSSSNYLQTHQSSNVSDNQSSVSTRNQKKQNFSKNKKETEVISVDSTDSSTNQYSSKNNSNSLQTDQSSSNVSDNQFSVSTRNQKKKSLGKNKNEAEVISIDSTDSSTNQYSSKNNSDLQIESQSSVTPEKTRKKDLSKINFDDANSDTQNNDSLSSNSPSKRHLDTNAERFVIKRKKDLQKSQKNTMKDDNETTHKVNKKTRKLYNLNETCDVSYSQQNQAGNETAIKNTTATIFKKPDASCLTPVLLTANARKQLERSKSVLILNSNKKTAEEQLHSNENEKISRKNKNSPTKINNNTPSKIKKITVVSDIVLQSENKNKTPVKSKKPETTQRRRSVRISQLNSLQTPSCRFGFISQTGESTDDDLIIPQLNRRSTLEFMQESEVVKKKLTQSSKKRQPSIVCTRLHNPEVQIFTQIVGKLGYFIVEDEVTARTTHLVVGECKRTINLLRAIARGCWILKHEWLLKSLEAEKWLPEEKYELTEFSPAVQNCRKERHAFGLSYSINIFEGCGPIFIARSSIPRCSDLKELIQLCKGKITTNIENAVIVVGKFVENEEVVCVKETWILDSITYNKKKSFKKYLLKSFFD